MPKKDNSVEVESCNVYIQQPLTYDRVAMKLREFFTVTRCVEANHEDKSIIIISELPHPK